MKIIKLKNKADHYNHINFKGKFMYDFEGGEIKEVDAEVIPYVNKDKFEIIEEETVEKKTSSKKTSKKTAKKSASKKK